jgi:hypothetical protein
MFGERWQASSIGRVPDGIRSLPARAMIVVRVFALVIAIGSRLWCQNHVIWALCYRFQLVLIAGWVGNRRQTRPWQIRAGRYWLTIGPLDHGPMVSHPMASYRHRQGVLTALQVGTRVRRVYPAVSHSLDTRSARHSARVALANRTEKDRSNG